MPAPADLDAPGAWLLHGAVEAERASSFESWGTDDQALTALEMLVTLHDDRYANHVLLAAVRDDPTDAPDPARVLGRAHLQMWTRDNTHTVRFALDVRPSARRQGVGTDLFAATVAFARDAGRTTLAVGTGQASEPSPGPGTLAPGSGTGLVRTSDPSVRFALTRGFTLAQVERYSILDVPLDADRLAVHRARAESSAGADYRLATWEDACPDQLVDQFAVLKTRMSTDAPLGGFDAAEAPWDAERVRASEDLLRSRGRRQLTTAAVHTPSSTLAAYTSFVCLGWTDQVVHQHDTLVLREHRGRRLGMLVKAANLEHLVARKPTVRRIGTWNAEENSHMLAINAALGFRPAGGSGGWQLRLT
ncbi:GNAT family N-acetyltransferase [Cellulomonas sp. KRMCY2]|uniref:GNAT family N-acetyltransferase n=1 Tax=Cellulomonas sp. KRMCY2 TaxID=1304865 RepID=UPI0004AE4656|nr:GNAT family N-acetyltransferase [Cellulomonas sp. KRMCY2]